MAVRYLDWHNLSESKDFAKQTLYALKFGFINSNLPYFSFVSRDNEDVIILNDSIINPEYLAMQIPQKVRDFGFKFSYIDCKRPSDIPEFGVFHSKDIVRFAEMSPKEKNIFTKTLDKIEF